MPVGRGPGPRNLFGTPGTTRPAERVPVLGARWTPPVGVRSAVGQGLPAWGGGGAGSRGSWAGAPGFQVPAGGLYLPLVTRTGTAGAGGLPWQVPGVGQSDVERFGLQGQGGRVGAARQGSGGSPAPPGIRQGWWDAFQREHGGQTPLQFYGRRGEGLAEALADVEWSEGFQKQWGRPPTEDDWRAWNLWSRGGWYRAMSDAERKAYKREARASARKDWAVEHGWRGWGEYEDAVAQGRAQPGQSRDEATAGGGAAGGGAAAGDRGPLWIPPAIVWR